MAGVTTRATKGSPLSATEHDDNLETIINLHKSATEPSPTYACMLWADTATTLLKQRNTADSAWTTLGTLDTAGSFGGGSSDVVDDTTPQLGGNLDMQAHSIEGVDATEIAILDGATVTTAELNILDGVTSTTAELNTLDGITSTVTELNYTDGVTSAIQTQLDAKLSSVADNSVTLAKMAGGTDGNLITYDASGDPAYVTTGTSGQVLTSGGTGVAPTFQTAAGGGDLSFGGDTFGADKTIGSNDTYSLSFETDGTERLKLHSDGRGLSQFTAKAWCNINGTGTPAFKDSHNCSSLTDVGTGQYRVNFTNNMASDNYAGVITGNTANNNYGLSQFIATQLAASALLYHLEHAVHYDTSNISFIAFGD